MEIVFIFLVLCVLLAGYWASRGPAEEPLHGEDERLHTMGDSEDDCQHCNPKSDQRK